jgi:hypothetical protein
MPVIEFTDTVTPAVGSQVIACEHLLGVPLAAGEKAFFVFQSSGFQPTIDGKLLDAPYLGCCGACAEAGDFDGDKIKLDHQITWAGWEAVEVESVVKTPAPIPAAPTVTTTRNKGRHPPAPKPLTGDE